MAAWTPGARPSSPSSRSADMRLWAKWLRTSRSPSKALCATWRRSRQTAWRQSPPPRSTGEDARRTCTSGCWGPQSTGPRGCARRRATALMKSRRAEGKLADFEIRDLRASVEGKEILKGVTLAINKGEVHAVMGPNGSGKSTLSHTLMGHPGYTVDGGDVIFKGQNVLALQPDERARLGMFLALQYPVVVPGISMTNFLRTALNAKRGYDGKDKSKQVTPKEFRSLLKSELEVLHMDDSFLPRYINDGFSGGEKKRAEILQMAILKPEIAILDETDSGLDIDSIKFVAEAVNRMRGPELGVLIITHYTRILEFITPDFVHVLVDGKFVLSGGPEIADRLEKTGYSEWAEADEPAVLVGDKPEEVA